MNEQRLEAYFNLIQTLLSCTSGEEQTILTANQELIDAGLVQMILQVANDKTGQGDLGNANRLRNIARQMSEANSNSSAATTEEALNFLLQVLRATAESDSNPQVVYPLLQENVDKLNDTFAQVLQSWANATLSDVELDQAQSIAANIFYLSTLIQDFPLGNKASNLELVITGYEIAATIFTRTDFPVDWAATQHHLGIAYNNRTRQNRAENLEAAIKCFQQALEVRTRTDFPVDWAATQHHLGIAYNNRTRQNRAENLEAAIKCFQQALEVRTRTDFPVDWAATQNNLGNVYSNRTRQNRAENLEAAIKCFQQALEVRTRTDFPVDWAATQNNLGNVYSNSIREDRAENLEAAIKCYQQALEVRTRTDFPVDWAMTQNNLGTAYKDRIRQNRAENLEAAIKCFQQALEVRTRTDFPVDWAMTQNNLGLAYNIRIHQNRAENLEAAIKCYQQALEVYTRTDFRFYWATIQQNLGTAYYVRIREDRAKNLEETIKCYQQALEVCTRTDFPVDWARIQNNLGAAYYDRIQEDRAENLEAAIKCYQQALEVRTRNDFPVDWATTQNNLGNAYKDRIRQNLAENLEAAIKCYQQALEVRTRNDFPVEWALTQNNLGLAYHDRIREDRAENLEAAIKCYQQALEVRTRTDFPIDWAMTQNNLGLAYRDRIREDQAENLEAAIKCYQQALEVRTRTDFPIDWAATQNNLGTAYSVQGRTAEAIEAFQLALEIFSPTTLPIDCLSTGRNLGNVAFTSKDWDTAIHGYAAAIDAVEQSRIWATSNERREEILESAIDVYQGIIQAYINNRQLERAIEYVERSKARNLVELLTNRDLYPKGKIPESVLNELDRLRREIPAKHRQLRSSQTNTSFEGGTSNTNGQRSVGSIQVDTTSSSSQLEQLQQELSSLQQELDDLIVQQLQPIDPSFSLTQKVQPISLQQIQDLLPDACTAIIEWYILNETLLTFTITSQSVSHWRSSPEDQKKLIELSNNYLSFYRSNNNQWQRELGTFLTDLVEILHLNEILDGIGDRCNQLILIPHCFLHLLPLHALPLPEDRQKCLLDRFERGVRYAPSCQLLQLTQNQQRQDFSHFFAIQNPTQNLPYTDIEVATIRRSFQPHDDVLVHQNATKEAISPERFYQTHCAHFSCHGYFNFEFPLQSALLLAGSKISAAPSNPDPNRYLPLRDGGVIDITKCLTLGDLFERTLDLRQCCLVTLSACETGVTDPTSLSDEYVGLPSGFLFAGSPSVVSSLWAVSDSSTAFLTIKFYQILHSQTIPIVAKALNEAQLWLRDITKDQFLKWIYGLELDKDITEEIERDLNDCNSDVKPFENPLYWAAFCAIGQ